MPIYSVRIVLSAYSETLEPLEGDAAFAAGFTFHVTEIPDFQICSPKEIAFYAVSKESAIESAAEIFFKSFTTV